MKCPKCGNKIPEDSDFCQYCGFEIKEAEVHTKKEPEHKNPSKLESCFTYIPNSSIKNELDNEKSKNQPRSSPKYITLVAILIVLLIGSIGFNVYQYLYNQNNVDKLKELSDSSEKFYLEIEDKNNTILKQDAELKSQASEISALKTKVSSLNVYSKNYASIVDIAKLGNLGYASNSFHSSDSIIVVKKGERNKKFTLTASWSNGGTVDVDYNPKYPSASVEFDNNSWSTSTTMTINPKCAGMTTVTFSNDVNNQTFNMIIIVEGD